MKTSKFDSAKLNTFLNKNEIAELEYLNKKAEYLDKNINDKKDILNLTINEFLKNWANTNMLIFKDLVQLFSNLGIYNKYFSEKEESKAIINGIFAILNDIRIIFLKKDRAIYIGITFILISILFYFIGLTS